MKILLVGGGSGGHVTPLKAVSEAIINEYNQSANSIRVITDKSFLSQTKSIFSDQPRIKIKAIAAGKLRRYSNKSRLWHVLHVPTLFKNIRDLFLIAAGIIQSFIYFLIWRPDVIFAKGGFVSVPVGFMAKLFKIRLIIHDSDTHPGLTNRILSGWASVIATGMPTLYYKYQADKMIYTGIPVSANIKTISLKQQQNYKAQLQLDTSKPLLLCVGGGTGSALINNLIIENIDSLLAEGWQVVLIAGNNKQQAALKCQSALPKESRKLFKVYEFVDLVPYILAADLIISRTGASAMQEFANAKKAVITIPASQLPGAHQLKNAQMFNNAQAALVLTEDQLAEDSELFMTTISTFSNNKHKLHDYSANLHSQFAKPAAAVEIAGLICKR